MEPEGRQCGRHYLLCISTLRLWRKCPARARRSTAVSVAYIQPERETGVPGPQPSAHEWASHGSRSGSGRDQHRPSPAQPRLQLLPACALVPCPPLQLQQQPGASLGAALWPWHHPSPHRRGLGEKLHPRQYRLLSPALNQTGKPRPRAEETRSGHMRAVLRERKPQPVSSYPASPPHSWSGGKARAAASPPELGLDPRLSSEMEPGPDPGKSAALS